MAREGTAYFLPGSSLKKSYLGKGVQFSPSSIKMRPEYTFAESDKQKVAEMQSVFLKQPSLRAVCCRSGDLKSCEQLDALYVSLAAAERLGVFPQKIQIHKAEILKTRDDHRANGWPPYIIAGVAMSKDDPRNPQSELRLIVRAVIEAVVLFNFEHNNAIKRVGFTSGWIGLQDLSGAEAGEIILESCLAGWKDAAHISPTLARH